MDFENISRFFPILIFALIVFIDKSQKKNRKKRGHFPPLPDMEQPPQKQEEPEYDTAGASEPWISSDKNASGTDGAAAKTKEELPWYVEFPEDRKKKEHERVYKEQDIAKKTPVYHEPAFILPQPAVKHKPYAANAPLAAAKPKKPLFNGRLNRSRVREGFIMAQILDKPRSLKPYTDPY